jgi:hypothetical protein
VLETDRSALNTEKLQSVGKSHCDTTRLLRAVRNRRTDYRQGNHEGIRDLLYLTACVRERFLNLPLSDRATSEWFA